MVNIENISSITSTRRWPFKSIPHPGNLKFARQILRDTEEILEAELTERFGSVGEESVVSRVVLAGGGYRNIVEQSGQVRRDMLSSVWISLGVLALIIVVFFSESPRTFCVSFPSLSVLLGRLV